MVDETEGRPGRDNAERGVATGESLPGPMPREEFITYWVERTAPARRARAQRAYKRMVVRQGLRFETVICFNEIPGGVANDGLAADF